MVLIQLLLPATDAARNDGVAPLAQTRRELAARFDQESIHVRAVPVDMLDEGQP
jgi:hypothetical protein